MPDVVCIGAGQASLSCAVKLRERGYKGSIALIGDEPHLPYQRPPLSKKYLTGEMDKDRLLLRPPEWFRDHDVACLTGQRVTAIDRAAKTVTLASGSTLAYGRLLIATGCTPRRLPEAMTAGLAGIYTVRNISDIDALMPSFRPGARLVVTGGGYIGLEAASVAAKAGMTVTVLELANRILERVACTETAAYFDTLHRSHGVDIVCAARLERIEGRDGRIATAILADGSNFPCDVMIVGIGVAPNVALARDAGLAIDNGIAVDELGRTSDPDILAAGDCTSFPHADGRLRLESVPHAIAHGEAAALTILGEGKAYIAKPWFWSDQYDVKLQIAGLNHGYDQVVARGPDAGGGYSVWYYRGGRLIAVDAMNSAAAYMVGKRLIDGGLSVAPERVADPAADMKSWLKP